MALILADDEEPQGHDSDTHVMTLAQGMTEGCE